MQQYNGIKTKYPDAILLFRVGDFYETFGEDAKVAAKILGIVLTKRGNGSESETALAGFPHHSLNTYLPKLVKAGHRVAICDQLEDPKMTKKIVKRGVTELVTPGVALSDEVLSAKKNNYLCAVHLKKREIGIAFLDISTGEFLCAEGDAEYIDKLLQNFDPSEVLVEKKNKVRFKELFGENYYTFYLEDWVFQKDSALERLTDHFQIASLKGFGTEDLVNGNVAAGAIMHYLSETQHNQLKHITCLNKLIATDYVWMDRFTVRNLELLSPTVPGGTALIDIVDHSLSPMGGRLLKRWLSFPLKSVEAIEKRQKAVKFFLSNDDAAILFSHQIQLMSDLERLGAKLATQRINPRELNRLKESLQAAIPIREMGLQSDNESLERLCAQMESCDQLIGLIEERLNEDAPVALSKGKVIRPGFDAELDELRQISQSGKNYLDQMVEREIERTGIPSLKIAFNNVFGYYIEVRNTHKDKVPEEWIRKQTLVSAERYITEELKQYESKILGAQEKIEVMEAQLYQALLSALVPSIEKIQSVAQVLAQLDCLAGFAKLALEQNYVRPTLDLSTELDIRNGRHPVIEQRLDLGEQYVANDVRLDRDQQQLIMITGPNMSGKSAILRQTALITILAQMGAYVPAQSAKIGLVDRIFTRVGASDNISMGESTFMVEMNETANILNNLSERSLVLLDEIGRGTSTYDGISIAWAIAEYLHEHPSRAKTLFATHYHELNDMTERFERIKNFNVSVKELESDVIFLRKLVPGGSRHSFGIHVARLAGMPGPVLHRANKMLKQLERSHSSEVTREKLQKGAEQEVQLSFFNLDDPLLEEIKDEILGVDLDNLTPIEALMKLNEIKRMIKKSNP